MCDAFQANHLGHELKTALKPIQKEAVKHIQNAFNNGINPICSLDMGVGKTLVACEVIRQIMNSKNNYKILIVHKSTNYYDPWIKHLYENNLVIVDESQAHDGTSNHYLNHHYIHGKDRFKLLGSGKKI